MERIMITKNKKQKINKVVRVDFSNTTIADNVKNLQGSFCNARFEVHRHEGEPIIGRIFLNYDDGKMYTEIKFYKNYNGSELLQKKIIEEFKIHVNTWRGILHKDVKPVFQGMIINNNGLFSLFKKEYHVDDIHIDSFVGYRVDDGNILEINNKGVKVFNPKHPDKEFFYLFTRIKTHDSQFIRDFIEHHRDKVTC